MLFSNGTVVTCDRGLDISTKARKAHQSLHQVSWMPIVVWSVVVMDVVSNVVVDKLWHLIYFLFKVELVYGRLAPVDFWRVLESFHEAWVASIE